MKRFDRKFGSDLIRELPESPAVYLFKDEDGEVLYAGKAKNIRRRLSSYRNAGRRKAHRKMRTLVREADSVEVRVQESEGAALLLENQLIRELRPRYNVDGAFEFLYPAIGTGMDEDRIVLCLTTEPERFESLGLEWHGTFRPRLRAREAFSALAQLVGQIGHVEPPSRRPKAPRLRGARLVAIRRAPPELVSLIRSFLNGDDDGLLGELCTQLLECPGARREAVQVEEDLATLRDFFDDDVQRLRAARRATRRAQVFVPREERDGLFIRARIEDSQL